MTKIEFESLSLTLQNLCTKVPTKWGKVQNDNSDNLLDLFKIKTFETLEKEIALLPIESQNYFKRRWFLYMCSQVDEYLFYRENNVKKNPNFKDQSWDIIINNTLCFDLKSTIVPKSLRTEFEINGKTEKK